MRDGVVFHEITSLTAVRIKLLWREPEALFWTVVLPVVLTAVLGYAFSAGKPQPSRVAVLTGNTTAAEHIVERLSAAPNRIVVERVADEVAAARKLRKAAIDALVIAGTPPRVRFDPLRPEGELAQLRIAAALGDRRSDVAVAADRRSERGSRYIDFLFFGVSQIQNHREQAGEPPHRS